MARARWLLIVALLLAPLAGAEEAGSFAAAGETRLPPGTEAAFAPLLLFNGDATRIPDFRLEASRLLVHVYEERSLHPKVTDSEKDPRVVLEDRAHRTEVFHDAEVTFGDVSEQGYLGFYPGDGARVSFTALSSPTMRAQREGKAQSHLGDDEERPHDSLDAYRRSARQPHLWIEGSGILRYEGSGLLKIIGPDLLISSRDGSRPLATGDVRLSDIESVSRWVLLELLPASVVVEAAAPWQMATRSLEARWEGDVRFTSASGSLETWEGRYAATGAPTVLSGRFAASVLPEVNEGRVEARMRLSGEMDRTDLRLQGGPLPQKVLGGATYAGIGLLVMAAVVGLGGSFAAGVWLARRRRAPPPQAPAEIPFTVDDCMAAATNAADDEDWPRAAEWLRRVRRLAPTSARSCADLAHALCQMGQRDEALVLYQEASRLSEDGEADFNGAILALEADRPHEEVEAWLERALWRTPVYVVDVEGDPAFGPLRGRSRFERLVTDAWARLEDVEGGASLSRGR